MFKIAGLEDCRSWLMQGDPASQLLKLHIIVLFFSCLDGYAPAVPFTLSRSDWHLISTTPQA